MPLYTAAGALSTSVRYAGWIAWATDISCVPLPEWQNDRFGNARGYRKPRSQHQQAGQIVGSANIAGHNREHAFLYTDGKMTDLGGLDGTEGVASCINNAGQIVGTSGSRGSFTVRAK